MSQSVREPLLLLISAVIHMCIGGCFFTSSKGWLESMRGSCSWVVFELQTLGILRIWSEVTEHCGPDS